MVQKKVCVYLYTSTYNLCVCVCVYRERAPRMCRNEQIKQMRQNVNGRYIQISFLKKPVQKQKTKTCSLLHI